MLDHQASGSRHSFTLIIEGSALAQADALVNAGCFDASIGSVDGIDFAEFDRKAPTLEEALSTAIWDVESVHGLRVRRVEPDDLVTAAEIAGRLGRSRESVRLLISGARGSGNFPPPVSHLRSRHRLWRWSEVARWAGMFDDGECARATLFAAVNAALESRRLAPSARGFVTVLLAPNPPRWRRGSAEAVDLATLVPPQAPSEPSNSYWTKVREREPAKPPAPEVAPPPTKEPEKLPARGGGRIERRLHRARDRRLTPPGAA